MEVCLYVVLHACFWWQVYIFFSAAVFVRQHRLCYLLAVQSIVQLRATSAIRGLLFSHYTLQRSCGLSVLIVQSSCCALVVLLLGNAVQRHVVSYV